MKLRDFERELKKTFEDRRLSRGEKRALRELVSAADPDTLPHLRNIAFRVARDVADTGDATRAALEWLEDVVKALTPEPLEPAPSSEAFFSPGDDPLRKIVGLLKSAEKSCDICVFTITDDRIADAIFTAHRRGVRVRIITDDDKSYDRGSDVARIEKEGIAVKTDDSPHHMHHKFAIFDRRLLLTGSYNWTRSAAAHNQENLIVTADPRLVAPFSDMFDRLWGDLRR